MDRDSIDALTLIFGALASVGTVGGFVWAIFLYSRELAKRKKRDDEDKRKQAKLITAWAVNRGGSQHDDMWRRVRNGSSQAAYNVRLFNPKEAGTVYAIGVLPPNEMFEDNTTQFADVVFIGNTTSIAIRYLDADNREWFRDWFGKLHGPANETADFEEIVKRNALPNWEERAPLPEGKDNVTEIVPEERF